MKIKIIALLFISTIIGCNKKESEILITQNSTPVQTEKKELETTYTEENQSLVMVKPEDELAILVRADGAPGMLLNDKGELVGFYVDLEKAIMKQMGQKYKLIPYTDVGPVIQKLKTGEIHSAIAAPDVPDFRALFNISSIYEVVNYVIFLPKSSTEVLPKNKEQAIRTLYGKKVGVQTRGHIYQLLRDHKEIEIIEYPTTTAALEALHNGEIDAVPDVKRVGVYNTKLNGWDIRPVGEPIHSLNVGTAFSKALDTAVLDRYNSALEKLISSGYVKELHMKYFGE